MIAYLMNDDVELYAVLNLIHINFKFIGKEKVI
jgi:hypothetical protein